MSKKKEDIIIFNSNDVIKDFNKGVSYVKLYDDNVAYWRKILSPTEFMVLYLLSEYVDEYNIIKYDNKYSSLQNMSDFLEMKYQAIRHVIPSLIKYNAICSYYIEVYDKKYIKVFILNPSIATREDFKPKYIELFENHKLIELNHALYIEGNRSTQEYHQWIQESLERDNYTCQCCGSTENLEVHHILNYAQYKDLRTDLENSITLCQCCHSPIIGDSFHNTYGTRNNTREQLNEYLKEHRASIAS